MCAESPGRAERVIFAFICEKKPEKGHPGLANSLPDGIFTLPSPPKFSKND
jgi:hypothetical protein